eukprot:s1840_g9.t1
MASTKKVNKCPDGGYKMLQLKIMGNREIKCKICQGLLEEYKFSQADCERAQLGELDETMPQSQENQQPLHEAPSKSGEIMPQPDGKKGRQQKAAEDDASDDNDNRYTRFDAISLLKSYEPMFTMLPAGTCGKKVPVRCNVCKSRSWPDGKVLEIGKLKEYMVKHFIKQHISLSTHFRHAKKMQEPNISLDRVPCQGLNIQDSENAGVLYTFRAEFDLWATYSNFADCAKHSYSRDSNNGPWTARSYHCEGLCDVRPSYDRQVCKKCLELGDRHGATCPYLEVVRNAQRFARKYWAAQLLSARLFQSEKDLSELLDELKGTALYQQNDAKLLELMELETHKLQQWVRSSFMSDNSHSKVLQRFVAATVKPALSCSVASVPEQMMSVMGRFMAIVGGTEASEEDAANLKIACAALRGDLSHHPLIQGLALQCSRLVQKRQRGISTMQGRRSRETERETALIADAGLTLAMHAGNAELASLFGLAASSCKISLEVLKEKSLPTPALALSLDDTLGDNFLLCDQRYPRAPEFPRRYLVIESRGLLAFDCTYLTATVSQMQLGGRRGLVGGMFNHENPDSAFIPMTDEIDIKKVPRASQMMEFVAWDPCLRRKHVLSLCSLPVQHSFTGSGAQHRGCWYVLELVGNVLKADHGFVKGLLFDQHGTHMFIRKCLHGQTDDLNAETLKGIPFFGELQYEQVWDNCLPRLPISICRYKGEIIWGLGGFICLDIFAMLADDKCHSMSAPTGSCFWAPQTVLNLQCVCLAGVLVTITKEKEFEPWRFGSARMTEISIEEHFSMLRRQSGNSQLTCRAFWQAAARVSVKVGQKLNDEQAAATHGGQEPFQRCCEKGYKAAIKLAALCSGHHEASIDAAYRKLCDSGGPAPVDELADIEEEIAEKSEHSQQDGLAEENERMREVADDLANGDGVHRPCSGSRRHFMCSCKI